jgi:hypothetical protein
MTSMSKQPPSQDKILFESILIHYVARCGSFGNDYDKLAEYLSKVTGKSIDGRKITFMARGEKYAKKWLIEQLLSLALNNGWMPSNVEEWTHVIWTLTGKKQSIFGGDNSQIYRQLADVSGKPEIIFEQCFNRVIEENRYGQGQ